MTIEQAIRELMGQRQVPVMRGITALMNVLTGTAITVMLDAPPLADATRSILKQFAGLLDELSAGNDQQLRLFLATLAETEHPDRPPQKLPLQ